MKTHNIKIREEFADSVLSGDKPFELRYNDRGYQKGDHILFNVVDKFGLSVNHKLNVKIYEITYVLNGFGLSDGYVALGIKCVS